MSYLLTEIVLFLILAYVVGLLTGWMLWHRSGSSEADEDLKRKLAESQSTVRNLQRKVDTLQARPTPHAPVPSDASAEATTEAPRQAPEEVEEEPTVAPSPPSEARPFSAATGPTAAAFVDDLDEVAETPPAPPPAPLPEAPADASPTDAPLVSGPTYDDLQRISGIGPVIERQLAELGVTTYRQIARFTDDDIERVGRHLDVFPDRVRREKWVDQAAALHRETYGTTP
ncbi:MAG: hypothetical protein AAGI52_10555 [Bacteroidota bacterium]